MKNFMNWHNIEAVILDLDGVITRTAAVHAQAWKQMFDAYRERRQQRGDDSYEPFDLDRDYRQYVDGKPRYEGVRSFLQSRGLDLPYGDPDDEPGQETICGLGNWKNQLYQDLLEDMGVEVFDDAVLMLRRWRDRGLKRAVVSSSKNCRKVLQLAGLTDLFDVRVDGVTAERLHLKGKPEPDIFLHAARDLGVAPSRAVVFEDAVAGVQAGRAGGFAWVVGVARQGQGQPLLDNGADVVVQRLDELDREGGDA
jgi:beta-phosphoglucomutase family hydrolase